MLKNRSYSALDTLKETPVKSNVQIAYPNFLPDCQKRRGFGSRRLNSFRQK